MLYRFVVAVIFLISALHLTPVVAQSTSDAAAIQGVTQSELEGLIERARSKGVEVIIVTPSTGAQSNAKEAKPLLERLSENLETARTRLHELIAHIPQVPSDISSALAQPQSETTHTNLWLVIAIIISLILLGLVPEYYYGQWLKRRFRATWPEAPPDKSGKIVFLLTRFIARIAGFAVVSAGVLAIAAALFPEEPRTQITGLTLIGAVFALRVMIEFWRVWITPGLPEFRMPPLNEPEAHGLFAWLRGSAIIASVPVTICYWLEALGIDARSHTLLLLAASLMVLIYHLVMLSRVRGIVASIIAGPEETRHLAPKFARAIAGNWHIILGLYLLATGALSIIRLVLGNANPIGPGGGMVLVLAATLTLFSLMAVVIDWWFYKREHAPNRLRAEQAARLEAQRAEAAASETDPDIDDTDEDGGDEILPEPEPAGMRTFEDLAKQAAFFFLVCFALGGLGIVWGVDFAAEDSIFIRIWDVGFVALVGYVAFQSVKIVIQQRLEEEGGLDTPAVGEGALVGVSRIATLLPLFRNFILIAIALLTMMIILSQLGIDIAPLFAGAGVIGLAIGFGAQTLIRDIFSGAFFLMDDAFRKGEYIDIGDVEGTVETISIRSMQVRHYDGPLHTIPFGEITRLTNFSRDWALMKLKVRVTYDTDVDKVRRLVKKLGKELLEDEEFGPMFLEPLKSQGVNSLEDNAMIIRMKFMTKPGDQFYLKRVINSRIQELFHREGIKFAHREVTVRVADEQNGPEPDDATKRAIAGAAVPELESAAGPQREQASDR